MGIPDRLFLDNGPVVGMLSKLGFGLVVDKLPSIVRFLVVEFPIVVVSELVDSTAAVEEGLGVVETSNLFATVVVALGNTLDEAVGFSTPVNC